MRTWIGSGLGLAVVAGLLLAASEAAGQNATVQYGYQQRYQYLQQQQPNQQYQNRYAYQYRNAKGRAGTQVGAYQQQARGDSFGSGAGLGPQYGVDNGDTLRLRDASCKSTQTQNWLRQRQLGGVGVMQQNQDRDRTNYNGPEKSLRQQYQYRQGPGSGDAARDQDRTRDRLRDGSCEKQAQRTQNGAMLGNAYGVQSLYGIAIPPGPQGDQTQARDRLRDGSCQD